LELRKKLAHLFEENGDFKSAAEVWQQAVYFGDKSAMAELERLKPKL